jgi:hypothetical protein
LLNNADKGVFIDMDCKNYENTLWSEGRVPVLLLVKKSVFENVIFFQLKNMQREREVYSKTAAAHIAAKHPTEVAFDACFLTSTGDLYACAGK